jgi:hypothetical protein
VRAALVLAACAAAATAAGCAGRADRGDLQPPPDFVPPPVRPLQRGPLRADRLGFGLGFFPLEVGGDGSTWRWMGTHGEIRLDNDGHPRRLRLRGWLPLEFLDGRAPSIRLSVDGKPIDSFEGKDRALDRVVRVGPEQLGAAATVLLTIETSLTARVAGDPRDLGIAVQGVDWGAAPPAGQR